MKRLFPYVVGAMLVLAAAPAWAAAEEKEVEEVAQKFLGLPVDLWKLANLVLILAFLVYFLGKPFNAFFRKRREDLDEALDRAREEREKAVSLAAEMTARLGALEKEIAEIRRRGAEDGGREKQAQLDAAAKEAENLRRTAAEEIDRRLAAAKRELARAAADLASTRARDVLAEAITDDDRRRLLDESVRNVAQGS